MTRIPVQHLCRNEKIQTEKLLKISAFGKVERSNDGSS